MNNQPQLQANLVSMPPRGVRTIAADSRRVQRISALDFTKGALVLIMVLYHWINYFIGPQWGYYQYLRFLTPSFIFITGFMISNVYLSKYAAADPRLAKRLFTRGLKLIAIFAALNLSRIAIIPLLGTGTVARNQFEPGTVFAVFVSGNLPVTGPKLVAFSILVPISYLLMFSGILVLPYRTYRHTFHAVCIVLLLLILGLWMNGAGSYNLEFVTIGMLGVLTGFVPIETINDLVRRPLALAVGYLCYLAGVAAWHVPFPLLVVGVLLSLMAIYLGGVVGGEYGIARREVALLGKYSLLGYISQIAILQILSAGFRRVDLGVATLGLLFTAAFALTVLSVEVVNRARAKSAAADKLYRAVFA